MGYETHGVCTLDHRLRGWSEQEEWGLPPRCDGSAFVNEKCFGVDNSMVLNTVNSLTLN